MSFENYSMIFKKDKERWEQYKKTEREDVYEQSVRSLSIGN